MRILLSEKELPYNPAAAAYHRQYPGIRPDRKNTRQSGCFIDRVMPGKIWASLHRAGRMNGDTMDKMNYTYIVRCSDGTLYTGWTTDVERRVRTHNSGKGAKYTRSRLPVTLVYYETYPTRQEAMRREWEIKQLTREEKKRLIADFV